MLWELWSNLTPSQQTGVFIAIPSFLFFMDILVKNGFGISIETAGGDLCLAAVCLDISQAFIAMSIPTLGTKLSPLLLILALIHLFLWTCSLRLISRREHTSVSGWFLGISYFFGLVAFYTALGTILQFTVQQGASNG